MSEMVKPFTDAQSQLLKGWAQVRYADPITLSSENLKNLGVWVDYHDPMLLHHIKIDSVIFALIFTWLLILTLWIVRHSRGG